MAMRKGFNSVIETGERLKDKLKRHLSFQHCDWDQNLEGLWNGMDLFKYPDGSQIPAQAWRHCKTLFLAASSTTGKGIVVEFGSWIGQSSRCLGAGINTTGYKEHLFSYDSYNNPINHNKFMGSKYENDEIKDFQYIWYETVLPVYPSARSVKGKIDNEHFDADLWPKKMIEVFAIDSAKTHKNFRACLAVPRHRQRALHDGLCKDTPGGVILLRFCHGREPGASVLGLLCCPLDVHRQEAP